MVQIPDESLMTDYLKSTSPENSSLSESTEWAIVPTQGLREFYFPDDGFNMMTLDIALSDWGVASWTRNHLTELIQPILLRAPEVILEAGWGLSVDIWNLGCLIPELIYAQRMFSGKTQFGEYTTKLHLEEMVALLGTFPRALLLTANPEIVQDIFDNDGNIRKLELVKSVGLDERFSSMPGNERTKFVVFIKSMLALDTERRKLARELLDYAWLNHEYEENIIVEA
jgi:serine/threonine-protein kinase SRPK3